MAAADEKRRLRGWARSLADPPAAEVARRDARICERVLELVSPRASLRVCLYSALEGEVSTSGIEPGLVAQGCELIFPRVDHAELRVHQVSGTVALTQGYRGIAEPDPSEPEVAPALLDVVLAPGVLFDRQGARLGRGGGHYDRLFAACSPRATRIGMCYAERVVERVPHESWDARVDWVVTEREVIRVADRRAGST